MYLPHRGVGFSIIFSLRGTNSCSGEFVLPLGESFLFLENWLCCYVLCCIPSTEFILDGGSYVQTAAHSFCYLSTRTIQYLGTHTFLGESFPSSLDSINALRLKLVVLTEATSGKGSSSIAIASFLLGNLSIPLLILSCMTFLKPQLALVVWFHELWYLQ